MGIVRSLGARKAVCNQAGQPAQLQRIAKLLKFFAQQVFKLAETFIIEFSRYSPVENKNDLEHDFKVFFFTDSFCSDIVHDESN